MKRFLALVASTALLGTIAATALAGTGPGITMTVTGPTPNPAMPSSVSTVVVTYTPSSDTPDVNPIINLLFTNGNGTLSIVSFTNELQNCVVGVVTMRAVTCDYDATLAAGPSVLTLEINVGPGAGDGDTWDLEVSAVETAPDVYDLVQTLTLDIVAAATTTIPSSTTAPPATTAPSTTAAVAPTSETLPLTGPGQVAWPAILASMLMLAGLVGVVIRGRGQDT